MTIARMNDKIQALDNAMMCCMACLCCPHLPVGSYHTL